MQQEPLVSIVMCVYNREKYVAESIDSVLNQTFKDYEFIIIDDGSTDRSREIIQSYDDPRIVYVENPENLGISKSRNIALNMAKGKYLFSIDSDDIALPQLVENEVKLLEKDINNVYCGSYYRFFNDSGRTIAEIKFPELSYELINWLLVFGNPFNNSGTMIRKDSVIQVGGYSEAHFVVEDYDLWIRLFKTGNFVFYPETLFLIRRHNTQITGVKDLDKKAIPFASSMRKHYKTFFGQEVEHEKVINILSRVGWTGTLRYEEIKIVLEFLNSTWAILESRIKKEPLEYSVAKKEYIAKNLLYCATVKEPFKLPLVVTLMRCLIPAITFNLGGNWIKSMIKTLIGNDLYNKLRKTDPIFS